MSIDIHEHSLRLAFDPYYSSLAGSLAVQIPVTNDSKIELSQSGKVAPVFEGSATGNDDQSRHQEGTGERQRQRKQELEGRKKLSYRPQKQGGQLEWVTETASGGRINIRV